MAGYSTFLLCRPCNVQVPGPFWHAHASDPGHLTNTAQQGISPNFAPEVATSVAQHTYCSVCNAQVPNVASRSHPTSKRHQQMLRFSSWRASLDEAEKDKHGVMVSGNLDFGIVEAVRAVQNCTLSAIISGTSPTAQISMVEVKLTSEKNARTTSSFSYSCNTAMRMVKMGQPVTVVVRFNQVNIGRYDDRLEIVFEDLQLKQKFIIVRPLVAIVGSKADHELLRPKAPYVPRARVARADETDVIPGEAPPALRAIPYVGKLPLANIPPNFAVALDTGSLKEQIERVRASFLPAVLQSATHGRHFKYLLWAEEHRMKKDLQIYDIHGAVLQRYGGGMRTYYYLEVPGLAEKRPSVLVGDLILVHKDGDAPGRWYEGHVHVVREKEVGLCFHASFRSAPRHTVHFKLNRIPLQRQYQALDSAFAPDRVLFPGDLEVRGLTAPPRAGPGAVRVFNPLIASNAPQLQAVTSILRQGPGALPFVIFGPPGTGKTVTMVEAIRQVLRQNPNVRILACAPSNSAADLIAERLLDLSPDEMFRFYAPCRNKSQILDKLEPYTSRSEAHFSVPPMSQMKRFRVIVSTCVSAAMPHGIGMPRGHFSHIFIDEAGQATEPEAMISIKGMADNATNIVLSGDPKQLGPMIRSSVARELGLEKSYLERLMERDVYNEEQGHGISVVKLVKNFRSHPAILKFPNENFYGGDLQPCGDPKAINAYIDAPILVSKKFPIVFHAISGKDDREASSPSFFNIDEATQVKAYVKQLRDDRTFRTADKDIGVIAPYHAQCLKIRNVLRAVADGVKVGSVEEFQGQERPVIIISTVRSSRDFVEYDLRHTLGFVANPRRFNVAVTRAKALLIIVGDPAVLGLDPLWRSFLNYVHVNGGWRGAPPDWDTGAPVNEQGGYDQEIRDLGLADMNEFTRRMESLSLAGMDANGDDDLREAEANVDRPWRELE
ncbi:hypothetical protein PLICRDRAFT_105552 [Plicaturopsis crispa FD-325 SS-3]|nr:hypothetical protein PLICRDRAFT_105552 [Plicaturopsis crispa FD-325 SS-3]